MFLSIILLLLTTFFYASDAVNKIPDQPYTAQQHFEEIQSMLLPLQDEITRGKSELIEFAGNAYVDALMEFLTKGDKDIHELLEFLNEKSKANDDGFFNRNALRLVANITKGLIPILPAKATSPFFKKFKELQEKRGVVVRTLH
jgi:hypothetical protein